MRELSAPLRELPAPLREIHESLREPTRISHAKPPRAQRKREALQACTRWRGARTSSSRSSFTPDSEEQRVFLARFDRYQIEGRYPDLLPPPPDQDVARAELRLAGELLQWLKHQL